jgi:hypothetical protein
MLAKGLRSHSLYNSVLYILSYIKIVSMLCGMLLADVVCVGLVKFNVIVQAQHINKKKYNNPYEEMTNVHSSWKELSM